MSNSEGAGTPCSFPDTRWSLVGLAAHGGNDDRQRAALATLLRRYLPALRAHLMAGRRTPADEVDDLLQDFVADKVISQRLLGRARRERGRFRAFLVVALNHYVIRRHRADNAQCRRPADGVVALDADLTLPAAGGDAADAYALAWARELLGEALRLMKSECDRAGRGDIWLVFDARVVAPTLQGAEPLAYDELVGRLGLAAPIEACNLLTTAKRMFARNLRAVAAEYADPGAGAEAELNDRWAIVSRAGGAESRAAWRSPW